MIPLCGIAIGLFIVVCFIVEQLRNNFNVHTDIPTDKELADLENKLNRMALDRANERNPLK